MNRVVFLISDDSGMALNTYLKIFSLRIRADSVWQCDRCNASPRNRTWPRYSCLPREEVRTDDGPTGQLQQAVATDTTRGSARQRRENDRPSLADTTTHAEHTTTTAEHDVISRSESASTFGTRILVGIFRRDRSAPLPSPSSSSRTTTNHRPSLYTHQLPYIQATPPYSVCPCSAESSNRLPLLCPRL